LVDRKYKGVKVSSLITDFWEKGMPVKDAHRAYRILTLNRLRDMEVAEKKHADLRET
jgi:hypothetical protein